jgi:hypothetical protein
MRFDREPRPQGYCWTQRKEAMYLRREARDAEKIARDYPLFVGQFEPRPTLPVEEERARRERQLSASDQRWRDLKASQWRGASTSRAHPRCVRRSPTSGVDGRVRRGQCTSRT